MTHTVSVSPVAKIAFRLQNFLLRRNWMGSMGNVIMVITTTGRKSGQQHSTPIGFLRDGDTVLAFNRGGASNWYKNVLVNPDVTLNIHGKTYAMRGQALQDAAEIDKVIVLYQREQPSMVERFFGITADAAEVERLKVSQSIKFVRFFPR